MTGSHDRSIRRWEKTDETFFLEEEKEKRLERVLDADTAKSGTNVISTAAEDGSAVVAASSETQVCPQRKVFGCNSQSSSLQSNCHVGHRRQHMALTASSMH